MESFNIRKLLLGPTSEIEFWDKYWENECLHITRNKNNYFKELISLTQFADLISYINLSPEYFFVSKDSKSISNSNYTYNGKIVKSKLIELHEQGATISIRNINENFKQLELFKVQCETYFQQPIQINAYLTPPNNQSVPPHWDTHDIFVLQIYGSKGWKLYKNNFKLPTEDNIFESNKNIVGEFEKEIVLNPGDTLYMPRGIIHEPIAIDYSIHLSVGIRAKTNLDFIINFFKVASLKDIKLRKVPMIDYKNLNHNNIYENIKDLILNTDLDIKSDYLNYISDIFLINDKQNIENQFLNVTKNVNFNLSTKVKLACGVRYTLIYLEDKLKLSWFKQSIYLPLQYKDLLNVILSGEDFTPSQLLVIENDKLKLDFVNTLVKKGLLVIK
jgi:hypothetical protein